MMTLLQRITTGLLVTLSIVIAAACGTGGTGGSGGGSFSAGGIGGTGAVATGTITGFGSVFVNGVEFETAGSSFDVDDDSAATEGDLALGMVVTIVGTINNDGVSGTANSIVYDDEVEGPVSNDPLENSDMTTKTFNVFDFTVVVNKNTTVFAGTSYSYSYEGLSRNDIVEVSGFYNENGSLVATRLEKQGTLSLGVSEVEIKGTITGFNGSDTFTVDGITVKFNSATDLSDVPGGVIEDGQFVEVKGTLVTTTAINATRIELEDEGIEDSADTVSLEGFVSDFVNTGNFRVSGQRVNAAAAVFSPAGLADSITSGDKVEVEGPVEAGVLQATRVEQRGGDVRISAVVFSRDPSAGSVSLTVVIGQPVLTVNTDSRTQLEDSLFEVEPFGLVDINTGDFLEIEGYIDGGGNIVAGQIQRDEPDRIELRGPVDVLTTAGDDFSGSVSILGIAIRTDEFTDFENELEDDISGDLFFDQVSDDDLVEYRDEQADGIAEEVEFQD
jgi:hypothetical protein